MWRGGVYLSQSVITLVKIKLNNKIIINDKKLYNVNLWNDYKLLNIFIGKSHIFVIMNDVVC